MLAGPMAIAVAAATTGAIDLGSQASPTPRAMHIAGSAAKK
jgi:hypothetical protein